MALQGLSWIVNCTGHCEIEASSFREIFKVDRV